MSLGELQRKIEERTAVLAVIGLGYVGLPVAAMFAEAGFHVVGLDIKADRVASINAGSSPITGDEPGLADVLARVVRTGYLQATTDYTRLRTADVVLINVETPVDDQHRPCYTALESACRSLGLVMQPGTLVVVESTVAPGTVDGVVRPLIETTSGMQVNTDFYMGVCPERVMPGKLLANLRLMSRVCGAGTPQTAQVMISLYRHIVQAELDPAEIITAELVKTTENAYRDVQIAFANEVALLCEEAGADVWRVRELVNKTPYRQMHLPGAGVGGHCIPKDPWLLAAAGNNQVPLRLIPAARAVNDSMPGHVAELVANALRAAGRRLTESRVAVLGYAYLENSDDTRNSPSIDLVAHLRALGIDVVIHDPWVAEYGGDLVERIAGCDAAVFMVKHQPYLALKLDTLRQALRTPLVIDGRGIFDPARMHEAGIQLISVGRGTQRTR